MSIADWENPEPSERTPRGNGVNVHLKDGTIILVADNHHEVHAVWLRARQGRDTGGERGSFLVRLKCPGGKSMSVGPEEIHWLEEL